MLRMDLIPQISNGIQNKALQLSENAVEDEEDDEEEEKQESGRIQIPAQSRINIDNSNDVVIGPVTQIHGPITIYQTPEAASSQQTREAKVISFERTLSKRTFSFDKYPCFQRRFVLVGVGFAVLIAIIIIIIVSVTWKSQATSPGEKTVELSGGHLIFEKEFWGGRQVEYKVPMRHPAKYVIISHTAGRTCHSFPVCASVMQQIQSFHVSQGLSDIGHNFLVGTDENVYVGRGWDLRNMHSDISVGIGFMGNYVFDVLTPGMVEATQELIDYGIRLKKISPDYTLVAHNQTFPTDSPGKNVYKEIKTWRNFNPNFIGT